MINKKVYEKLIEVAKKNYETPDGKIGIIYYEDLVAECELLINLSEIDDRNKLSSILGEISKEELNNKRPPISVLVILKNSKDIMPSYGFFNYMDELGDVRLPNETNEEMRNRLMNDCYDYWKDK